MKVLTAAEMAEVDRRTAEEFGVPLATLMENAGGAVARFCLRRFPGAKRVVVFCGKGNNGGDGLVAARVLAGVGSDVRVVLLGRGDEVKGEAAEALRRLRVEASEVGVTEVVEEASLREILVGIESDPTINLRSASVDHGAPGFDLVVDAVLGTGFRPPLRGVAAGVRDWLAGVEVPVVAVDLPSGWDADSVEQTADGAFRADAVVTFTAPKRAHVFGHLTSVVFGPVVAAEIGSPEELVEEVSNPTITSPVGLVDHGAPMAGSPGDFVRLRWAGASKAVAEKPRDVNGNKGKFGHVLVVGGSYGTAGAPAMASLAALRTGAGLVTAAVPGSVLELVAGIAPELMVRPLGEGVGNRGQGVADKEGGGGLSLDHLGDAALAKLLKGISVVGIGPGLGQEGTTPQFVRGFVEKVKLPMAIDADALNAFAGRDDLLNGEGRVMVLTPHPGEMARLVGMTVAEVEADRIGLARRFATDHQVTLVLKGWRTLVAHPDGRIAVNTSGNPAMAKGGSGDILTGIVAAMLAQYSEDVATAVEAAVYLHGLAGDFAARKMDEHTVLATDTVTCLSDAFRYRVRDEDGLSWICGMQ